MSQVSVTHLRIRPLLALAFFAALALLAQLDYVNAQEAAPELLSSEVISQFPKGISFRAEIANSGEIEVVTVRFRIGRQLPTTYGYLELDEGATVSGEYFHRTDTAGRYVPPGTPIIYHFELEDTSGNRVETEPQVFIYTDPRFDWKELESERVTLSYYGGEQDKAQELLATSMQTLNKMGPLIGADIDKPFRITLYNNESDMLDALAPGSATVRGELVTSGQAYSEEGVILILGSGSRVNGTISHEVTHLLVHDAMDNPFHRIPSWLNEGLAEYGNVEPGTAYDEALQLAIEEDRLMPITHLNSLPGTPDDIVLFYGEARSVTAFLVDRYGADELKNLLSIFKGGKSIDDAMEELYGFDREGLDSHWGADIGAQVPPISTSPPPPPSPTPQTRSGSCNAPVPGSGTKSVDVTYLAMFVGLASLVFLGKKGP